jgi:hypothetical protein
MDQTPAASTTPPLGATLPTGDRSKSFLRAIDRVLYPITLGYTAVIFGFQLYEFSQAGAYTPRYPFGDVYLPLLTAYAAQREGANWLGQDESMMRIRRGELFIGLWFALYLAMIACANFSARWVLPGELKTIALGVLGIFAATGISASVRQARSTGTAKPRMEQEENDNRVKMIELLQQRGTISSYEAAEALAISQPTAWRTLEKLVETGRARQIESGNSRERRYALP